MTSQDRLIQKERQLLQAFEEATDNRRLAESISNDFEWYDRESLRLENSLWEILEHSRYAGEIELNNNQQRAFRSRTFDCVIDSVVDLKKEEIRLEDEIDNVRNERRKLSLQGGNEMELNMTLEQSEEQARSTQSVCQAEVEGYQAL
ncbi:hypothetical protein [uncultured Streptococcus sp.]|uniref:hypothetical protein n=1 Tax=uncultured Streptococcus sp. TaxID=83427 RepID=UPI002596A776|nr:hypothetical protein [uncultured Streptococcus sp.]